jgi:hypothetical protein
MTHAEITAALRNDVETHCDVYSVRTMRPERRPDPVAVWRSNSRSRQQRVADDSRGARERPVVECVVSHGGRSEESRATTEGTGRPTQPVAAACECGHAPGDHQHIRGAGLFAKQQGRCLITGCDCRSFTETDAGWNHEPAIRPVPGTNGRRHV